MSNFKLGDWVVVVRTDDLDHKQNIAAGMVGEVVSDRFRTLIGLKINGLPVPENEDEAYWFLMDQLLLVPSEVVQAGDEAVRLHVALAHSIVI